APSARRSDRPCGRSLRRTRGCRCRGRLRLRADRPRRPSCGPCSSPSSGASAASEARLLAGLDQLPHFLSALAADLLVELVASLVAHRLPAFAADLLIEALPVARLGRLAAFLAALAARLAHRQLALTLVLRHLRLLSFAHAAAQRAMSSAMSRPVACKIAS